MAPAPLGGMDSGGRGEEEKREWGEHEQLQLLFIHSFVAASLLLLLILIITLTHSFTRHHSHPTDT